MVISMRRWQKRLGIYTWRILPPGALIMIVVMVSTTSTTVAVAATAPTALGHTTLLAKLPGCPIVIGVMCVPLVEDAVSTTVASVTLGAVVVAMLLLRLHHEDGSLLALGVLGLDLGQHRYWGTVDEHTSFLSLGTPIYDLE
jgi:hypothetical protein